MFGFIKKKSLERKLSSSDDDIRIGALAELDANMPQAEDWLANALSDSSPSVRVAALKRAVELDFTDRARESAAAALNDEESADVRAAALQVLSQHGDERHRPLFAQSVRDGDAGVARAAIAALASTGGWNELVNALAGAPSQLRQSAFSALVQGPSEIVDRVLIEALADPDATCRRAAAQSLAGRGRDWCSRTIQGDDEDFARLAQANEPEALIPLAALLRSKDAKLRQLAVQAFGRSLDLQSLDILGSHIAGAEGDQQAHLARLRGLVEFVLSPAVLTDFLQAISEDDQEQLKLGLELLTRLARLGPVDDALATVMANGGKQVKLVGIMLLSRAFDLPKRNLLVRCLADADEVVRGLAAEALDMNGEPGWKKAITGELSDLRRLVDSGDPVAIEAVCAATESQRSIFWPLEALKALARAKGPAALAALKRATKSEELLSRSAAAEALGQRSVVEALDELIELTSDPEKLVRTQALTALGKLRARKPDGESADDGAAVEKVLPVLERGIRDDESMVRDAALESLGKLGHQACVPVLVRALSTEDATVKTKVLLALVECGELEYVAQRLNDVPDEARRSVMSAIAQGERAVAQKVLLQLAQRKAAGALEYLGRTVGKEASPEVVEFLRSVWRSSSDDQESRNLAANVLVDRLGDPHAFIEASQSTDSALRRAAVACLSWLGKDPKASAALFALVDDPLWEVRLGIASGIRSSSDPRVLPQLRKWLVDQQEHKDVRVAAATALAWLDDKQSLPDVQELASYSAELRETLAPVVKRLSRKGGLGW